MAHLNEKSEYNPTVATLENAIYAIRAISHGD